MHGYVYEYFHCENKIAHDYAKLFMPDYVFFIIHAHLIFELELYNDIRIFSSEYFPFV